MPKEGEDQNEGNHATGAVSLNIEEVSELNSKMATEKEKYKNDSRAQGEKKEDSYKSVPFYKLFVTADSLDIMLMCLGSLGSMGNGASIPLMTVLFGNLINSFGSNTADKHKLMHEVSKIALEFVYLACGAGVAAFLGVCCWMCTGERQAARIRSLYLKTILRQDIAFFDSETSTGEVIGRMSGDTILIQEAMGEKVGKLIQFLTTFLAGFTVAFIRGWKLTLVLLSIVPLLVIAGGFMAVVISKMSSRGQQAYAEAANTVEQAIGSIRTVVSFTGERKSIKDYDKSLKVAYKAIAQQGLAAGFGLGFLLFIMFSGYALALYYGSQLILKGSYNGGQVVNCIFAVLMGGMSLGQASPSITAISAGRAAAYKMFETIDRKPDIDIYDETGLVLEDIQGDIELRDIQFRYPARPDVQIFSGFSLEIPRGTTAALVGESGSGKSTVISLIERFYDPQAGEVLIDGINIKKFQLKWIRQKIGLVSQEPVLFGTTIKENLLYGKDGATQEELKAAAELANAAKFINKMPQGFDTMVGEHGTQLSGGQKQRIAIARAILKDPRILLLDEATSALDSESERVVQEALDRIMVNRTTVVVAHRLTTVRNADMIAVVQRGSIVEKGSHSQLITNPSGAYSQLIRLQEMHQSKEQHVKDPDELEIHQEDSKAVGRVSSQRLSFRRSISSGSPEKGGSRRSYSFSYAFPAGVGLQETGGSEANSPKGNQKGEGLMRLFRSNTQTDVEGGQADSVKDVPILRLASLNKPEFPVFILGSIAAVLNGMIFPIFGLLLSSVIKVFYEPHQELEKDAKFWSLMFVVLAITCLIVAPTQMYCFSIAGGRLVQRIRSLTFAKVIHQEIGWFDDTENSSGAISARLSTDAAAVRSLMGDALSLVVQNIATIVAGIVISFTANWQLALLILAVIPLLGLQGFMQMRFMQGFTADAKVVYEEASQVANDAVGSIRTVASFCAEDKVINLYNEKCATPVKSGVKQGLIAGSGFGLSNFVMFSQYALSFWVGARLVQDGKTTFDKVFKVFFALSMAAMGVSQSAGLAPDLAKVKASVNSVFKILDRKSKIDASDPSGTTLETVKGDIEFQHVSFKYPTRPDVQIFRDLCLFVHSGKTVALVGESGSGKSTAIALLERFYDPDSGQIFLDGIEIRQLQLKWLRDQMGLVSQEPVLFNETIRANIAYGKEGAVTDEQITAATEASNAHKFISALPQGYDTAVGERGVQLSGGQKQRIAIARAILKDPRILLLDEATSALDAESERVVQDALDRVMVNRSTIVIAHRLSTIKDADLIAVVKNGVIAEQGKHNELLSKRDGAYASLVKLHQASS
ncbi:ABC transporter B family member 11 [Cryptomeria japonica]|uniref:ABC transporter B family member 11 n=1 Tax=Cryptomeria japonica TaxID=3369 RepID=UPI0025ABBF01|nr:ABC transporter B family member 11 [Cryptomeria japonica]